MKGKDGDLITASQAARMAGVSPSTIYRWFDQRYIEGRQYPTGTIRIKRESVIRLIDESTPRPRSPG